MNAPVVTDTRLAGIAPDWQRIGPPLALGVLLLGLLFNKEVIAAVQTWDSSTAYNHCFLVIPIALYLLWDRRQDLVGIAVRPMPTALLLGLPLAAIWLLAERLGIMEGRQLVAVAFVEVLFLAVLGKRLWWAMAGPLLYLFFLVPFGEFLTPGLQDLTTFFVRHGLDAIGIPAYIDGYIIEIPQGTFFIAEACAGLRFLIASIAFGCLYALIMYRSPTRRGLFILASIIVPIFANGLRAIGIVTLGYVLGSAQAAAADHVIYGWIFFSLVILLLIALGLPFRQDEISTRSASPAARDTAPASSMRAILAVALGTVALAAISPAIAGRLAMAAVPPSVPAKIDVGPDCVIQPGTVAERSAVHTQRVLCGEVPMDMAWVAFSPRSTAGPIMAERRRLAWTAITAEDFSQSWLNPGDGTASAWQIMSAADPGYIVAVSVWVEGRPVRPGLKMRLRLALDSLLGSDYAPIVVAVTPVVDWDRGNAGTMSAAEASLTRFLVSHPTLDQTIGTLSAIR
ncbi:MAG TPA: exosortase [Acetobacteraceae bacterium]|jgi:exosortase A|nr:exosortase [Acetobacteraceae bacterium]